MTVHPTFSCFRDRTFAAAATRVWNSFPLLTKIRLNHTPSSGGS